jgi:pimeloyl-ACP methyl ester carboxylesterase
MKLFLTLGVLGALGGATGCGQDTTGSGGGDQTSQGPLTNSCTDDLDDVYAAIPSGPQTAGAILAGASCTASGRCLKCATDVLYEVKDIQAALQNDGFAGKPTHNLQAYRFVYGTTRVRNGAVKSGASSALYFLPASTIDPDTLVVVAYDTVGFGPQCAPSLEDPRSSTDGDDHAMALAIASHGYRTVVIDFAGMGLGTVPPGWSLAEDEAHSLLDATRAVDALTPKPKTSKEHPKAPETKVVLVGLGEGGHAVLSAQAMATSYGLADSLAGVVAFAPIWVAPRTWGAALSGAGGLNTNDDHAEIAFDLLYFYGHGELYDGPGGGVSMLRDEQRSAASDLIERRCFSDLVASVHTLGKVASDIFDPTFVHQVSSCAVAGGGASCHQGAAETWNPRFTADRPAVDPEGAPILVWQGGADTLVPPDRAICGQDTLVRNVTTHPSTLTYCGDEKATHGSVVEQNLGWVIDWIDHTIGHGSAPKACAPFAPEDANHKPVTCATPPPNSD